MNIEDLVSSGESDSLEFKKSTGDLKGGMETLCAFLNGAGGTVLFGVTDKRKLPGITISDKTLQDVANEIRRLEPAASISMVRHKVPSSEESEILELSTVDTSQAPYTFRGRPYRRVGTTTSLMLQSEYERLLLNRDHPRQRWETQVADGYTIDDLDETEIRRMIREATEAGRLESTIVGASEALDKLHLLVDGELPCQAAVVAFAREISASYPQCGLRLARFRGVSKSEFLDQRQLTGNAFRLLGEADTFLRRHLPVEGRFEPGLMERQDEPLFPPIALREALVNALCHRDYSIPGGAVSVSIFDDRLEIASTGTLPFGLTVEDLLREHTSRPRNPLLADIFYRRGLIERWGRGTQKIVELCVEAGHPEPQFEERAGEVVVRFLVAGYVAPHRVSRNLTDRQRRILHFLQSGEKVRFGAIRSAVDPKLPDSTLRDDLNLLRELELVRSGGQGRGAWWMLAPGTRDSIE